MTLLLLLVRHAHFRIIQGVNLIVTVLPGSVCHRAPVSPVQRCNFFQWLKLISQSNCQVQSTYAREITPPQVLEP